MIDFSRNHFQLFDLPQRFRLDSTQLERAYHALQGAVHPDRFAAAGALERRLAMQSSARVNEAYRALKEPVSRAQYLLSLHGVEAFSEADTTLAADFLERQLERREDAEEALSDDDDHGLATIAAEVRAESRELEQRLSKLLDVDGQWEAARAGVRELRFLAKLAEDIDAMLARDQD
jgi:molecular chaperone HscB